MARYYKHLPSGKVIYADNATEPRRGKPTWAYNRFRMIHPDIPIETDNGVTIELDAYGSQRKARYEEQWGEYMYFELDGSWYKVAIHGVHDKTCDSLGCDECRGLPANFDIFKGPARIQRVSKAEWEAYREKHGFHKTCDATA